MCAEKSCRSFGGLPSDGETILADGCPHLEVINRGNLASQMTEDDLVTPKLSPKEEEKADERRSVPVLVVLEAIRKMGDEELERTPQALAWSGFAAGLSMGASLIVQGLLRAHLPNREWRPIVQQFGYPFGFLMLVLGRQQLFTENTVTAIVPLLARRNWQTFRKVATLWSVVLVANMLGAHIVSWALSNTNMFQPKVQAAFQEIALEASDVSFGTAILKGIVAGWLIAMMIWMISAVKSGELAIIFLMTYVVGLGALTHIVAGSVEVLFLVWNGKEFWRSFAGEYATPTLIGNIMGGVSLVTLVNHAQVIAGSQNPKAD